MPVLTEYERQTDDLLAEQAGGGDRDAFAALYERYFSGLYDFAIRMLRQEDAAADVVQNTFMKAWDTMQKKNIPGNIKAWLYAVARNNAIDEIRHRKRMVPIGETAEAGSAAVFAVADPARVADPEILLQRKELVDLVWESAAGLSPTEYALLDLHLRRGLNADELATSLRLRKGAVYTKLSRLKDSLEESVVSTLMLRHGRRSCSELNRVLDRLRVTRLTPKVRKPCGHTCTSVPGARRASGASSRRWKCSLPWLSCLLRRGSRRRSGRKCRRTWRQRHLAVRPDQPFVGRSAGGQA